MTNDKDTEQLDDFLNGTSELSKVYAENESIKVPSHLEFSVKQMARDDMANVGQQESKTNPNSDGDSPDHDPDQNDKKSGLFVPFALAACLIVALVVSLIMIPKSQTDTRIAKPELKEPKSLGKFPKLQGQGTDQEVAKKARSRDALIGIKDDKEASNAREHVVNGVGSRANKQIANDVKKTPIKPRKKLATNANKPTPKNKPTNLKDKDAQLAEQQKTFELPEHLNEFLQQTNASNQRLDGMPPDEVLQSWLKPQWVEQVKSLIKQGKRELAKRYTEAFAEQHPNDSIKHLLH